MEHSFDIDIAKKYGIPSAILLKHLQFWIAKNKANETNYNDGCYWTYNSKKAFAELFPYMTARQIDYALQKLIDAGLVITGNYNKVAYDRTLWYAITKKGYSILQNCEMDETKLGNGNPEIVQPIPYKYTDTLPNRNTDKKKERKKESKSGSFDRLIADYAKGNAEIVELLLEWLKVRKAKRAAMTDKSIELNLRKLDALASESGMTVPEYLREVICRGWQAFYPIKTYQQPKQPQGGNVFLDLINEEDVF